MRKTLRAECVIKAVESVAQEIWRRVRGTLARPTVWSESRMIERLEERRMLAVTVTCSAGSTTVNATSANEEIVVSFTDPPTDFFVQVNGQPIAAVGGHDTYYISSKVCANLVINADGGNDVVKS